MTQVIAPHIEKKPGVLGGRPKIEGKRFAVEHVYVLHEKLRMTPEEIVTQYDLTLAEVFAALSYAYDHEAELKASLAEEEKVLEAFAAKNPSRLREILREQRGPVLPG